MRIKDEGEREVFGRENLELDSVRESGIIVFLWEICET